MPFSRPTLSTIRDRVAADIDRLCEGNPYSRGSLEFAVANAVTGASHELHGAIAFYANQLFDDSAEDEFIQRRAEPFGVTRIAAVKASGSVTITGNDTTVIDAGTELQAIDGQLYTTDAEVTIAAGTATAAVTASEAGAAGNQDTAVALTFTTPVSGADSEATVDAPGLTGGADDESLERFKQRFAERKQNPPKGGAPADYVAWAKQAHVDVTRVWVIEHQDPLGATEYGSVLLYLVTDDLASVIPTQTVLDAVSAYIDQDDIRPAGVKNVYVEAPTAVPLDLTFSALSPNSTAVQQAIEAEIKDLLAREAEPDGTIAISHIREAISVAAGEDDYTLDSPTADVTANADEIVTLGTITWPAL